MPQLRLALNQIDSQVGNIAANADSVVHWTRHSAEQGAHLVAFPEMMLTGYPVEDLTLRASFVEASRTALRELAERLAAEGFGGLPVVVGYLDLPAARAAAPAGRGADGRRGVGGVRAGGAGVGWGAGGGGGCETPGAR
ncbi:nitrilase-related carbon-nitrogen hydrolase, partial [Streptomyces vinaceus]|uniref:nitrilase-related carbon-nitrogen hydrolase n=1 Tax=Streptomyces vinaceus TaxID=1960 RepID=UPI0036B56F0B